MSTIMVADAQPLYRAGLVATLQNHLAVTDVREEADYHGVLRGLSAAPDTQLLSVDLDLPGMNELAGLPRLRQHNPGLKVVVVAWPQARRSILNALAAGAHGYVPKQLSAAEMAAGFRTVLGGQIYVPPVVCDLPSGARHDGDGAPPNHAELLTHRQREVLTLLSAGKSNKEIARALMIAESTVKVHITAAFRLLGVRSRMAAAAVLQRHTAVSDQPDLPGFSLSA